MTSKTRKMRNPEKWIGRTVPNNLEWDHCDTIGKCDDCQRFWWSHDLHALLYPQSAADLELQDAVHVEEAEVFCPACLAEIESSADEVDPAWRERHELQTSKSRVFNASA